jgi:hypothetical protein
LLGNDGRGVLIDSGSLELVCEAALLIVGLIAASSMVGLIWELKHKKCGRDWLPSLLANLGIWFLIAFAISNVASLTHVLAGIGVFAAGSVAGILLNRPWGKTAQGEQT